MGNPQHKPSAQSRQKVLTLTGYGIPQVEIANVIECDGKTLRKHYRRELDIGMTQANAAVAAALHHMATKDKIPAAAIWWTKARMGWKEATDLNVNNNSDPTVLHLLAARWVSDQLAKEREVNALAPPTINGVAESAAGKVESAVGSAKDDDGESESTADWRDAPPPTE